MLYSFFRRHIPSGRLYGRYGQYSPDGQHGRDVPYISYISHDPPLLPWRLFRAGAASLAAFFALVCCVYAQDNEPLRNSAAWREGMAQLEKYRQGGAPPPPLRLGVSLAAPPALRVPPLAPPRPDPWPDPDWKGVIRLASQRHGVDEDLLTAVMQVESNFNPQAVSSAGARGLMQIMPETGRELGLQDFFDPAANTDAGARYLAEMLRLFSSLELALAAYNAGPAAVRQHGWIIPPYRETRDYVARVLSVYNRLAAQRRK